MFQKSLFASPCIRFEISAKFFMKVKPELSPKYNSDFRRMRSHIQLVMFAEHLASFSLHYLRLAILQPTNFQNDTFL